MRRITALLFVTLAVLIAGRPLAAGDATIETAGLPEILATVGDSPITRSEIETELGGLPPRLDHGQYEVVEKALERAVDRKLLQVEAAERGLGVEELVELEVEDRLSPPTAEEVRSYWQANRAHLDDWGVAVAEQIRRYLLNQRRLRRRVELMAELAGRHPVRDLMGPFRLEMATEGHPSRGRTDAPVTLVTFSDFECAACFRLERALERLRAAYGEEVRQVFRQFPAGERAAALKAAEASLCAHEQGRFWTVHDRLFARDPERRAAVLLSRPETLALEPERFNRCLEQGTYAARVRADLEAALAAGAVTPPVTFVNGRLLTGAPPYERLAGLVEDELSRAAADR